ncbi:MAG: hypothetical protein AAF633_16185 [Chloroflexota bacterium]
MARTIDDANVVYLVPEDIDRFDPAIHPHQFLNPMELTVHDLRVFVTTSLAATEASIRQGNIKAVLLHQGVAEDINFRNLKTLAFEHCLTVAGISVPYDFFEKSGMFVDYLGNIQPEETRPFFIIYNGSNRCSKFSMRAGSTFE